MVEFGKELDFVMARLRDISYGSDNLRSVDPNDPHAAQRLLGEWARQAIPILSVAMKREPGGQ